MPAPTFVVSLASSVVTLTTRSEDVSKREQRKSARRGRLPQCVRACARSAYAATSASPGAAQRALGLIHHDLESVLAARRFAESPLIRRRANPLRPLFLPGRADAGGCCNSLAVAGAAASCDLGVR